MTFPELKQLATGFKCPNCGGICQDDYGVDATISENYEYVEIIISLLQGMPFSYWTQCDQCDACIRVNYVNPRVEDNGDVTFDLHAIKED